MNSFQQCSVESHYYYYNKFIPGKHAGERNPLYQLISDLPWRHASTWPKSERPLSCLFSIPQYCGHPHAVHTLPKSTGTYFATIDLYFHNICNFSVHPIRQFTFCVCNHFTNNQIPTFYILYLYFTFLLPQYQITTRIIAGKSTYTTDQVLLCNCSMQ
jgi:hypothetical protein